MLGAARTSAQPTNLLGKKPASARPGAWRFSHAPVAYLDASRGGELRGGLRMIFYDFFSGCGGTSQGMREAGLTIRLGIDFDPDAAKTYRKNFKSARFIEDDIRSLKAKDIAKYISSSGRRRPISADAQDRDHRSRSP